MRIGIGYDIHRLVEGRDMLLGGINIDHELGFEGHSDGDVLLHAVADAILGAMGEGDIGELFPDTDPRWKDADSAGLLAEVVNMMVSNGFTLINMDSVIIAETPRIGPYRENIRNKIAGILGVAPSAVSIKGKTAERTGDIGAGKAVAVHTVVLLDNKEDRKES